jgi:hypothetical protein
LSTYFLSAQATNCGERSIKNSTMIAEDFNFMSLSFLLKKQSSAGPHRRA